MDAKKIEEIVKFSKEHGVTIICDEIYNLLNYTNVKFSAAQLFSEYEDVVIISGFSKAFAMSGWRVGYAIADKNLCDKLSLFLQTTISCTNTIAQMASIAALTCIKDIDPMKTEYMAKRDFLVEGLNKIKGIKCRTPMGAFYAFANVSGTGLDGEKFCDLMLLHGVALLPGTNFGPSSKDYVRFCFTKSMDEIKEGLSRIKKGLKAL